MRQIGTIADGELAERFADFLRGQGTACSIDPGDAGWAVWIHEEDRITPAKAALQDFLADPHHARYRAAREEADARLREEFERRKAIRRQTVSVRDRWSRPLGERCPLTLGLLAICGVVAVFTRLGGQFVMPGEKPTDFEQVIGHLLISTDGRWTAIRSGEIWRIWTPIFLHFGWMHLLFNGFCLKDFGMFLEDRLGSLRYLVLILFIGGVSNVLQFVVAGGNFGGMSGVIYGFFGYLWIRGLLDPGSGLGVSQQTITWLMIWFALCWTGLLGPVANWAHAGGLVAGGLLGALAAVLRR